MKGKPMSDKRKVSTDALETLGMIHTREEKRDAIHLAVIPAVAGEDLAPAEDVKVKDGVAVGAPFDGVGIVDPFLDEGPSKGERFWLVIYPRKITSLRHVWSHPAFPDEATAPSAPDEATAPSAPDDTAVAVAKAAIHAVAFDLGVSDEALMEGAEEWLEGGGHEGYMLFGHDLNYGWDMEAFWNAYALLTGRAVPDGKRVAFFQCAC